MTDELSSYDYPLPAELIARYPAEQRDAARLMVVDRRAGSIAHRRISDLPELLIPGDCLVLNDTRVIPARLLGRRAATGGRWEGLFLEATEENLWQLMGQTRGKLQPGERIEIYPAHHPESPERLILELLSRDDEGLWLARPVSGTDAFRALEQFGTVPLPPYMERGLADPADFARYQTTYAVRPGSVAAPTAGLHFTPELLAQCAERGIDQTSVTLHVGIGTFRPISVERLSEHKMHSEWCEVSTDAAEHLHRTRSRGGRIVAVGTTSVRTLESSAHGGHIQPFCGRTEIFIRPPYEFHAVDALLTNFHLPRSTLFVLVCTLAGSELMRAAYTEAIRERYRFFSYGDAMLIV